VEITFQNLVDAVDQYKSLGESYIHTEGKLLEYRLINLFLNALLLGARVMTL
jgi:hypothetical protein